MNKAKGVDEYIRRAPEEAQGKLRELRAVIKSAAPGAVESISYGMPGYDKGRVCWFGLSKRHIGLYIRPPVIARNKKTLAGYKTTKSAVHLPLDKKTPVALIKKLVKARIKLNDEIANPAERGKPTICSRGHRFRKSREMPVCPVCWPGRYKQRKAGSLQSARLL